VPSKAGATSTAIHSAIENIPWILHDDGKTRRATAEEFDLWDALVKAEERARVAENIYDQTCEATDHQVKGKKR